MRSGPRTTPIILQVPRGTGTAAAQFASPRVCIHSGTAAKRHSAGSRQSTLVISGPDRGVQSRR